jgi:putative transposase
MKLTQVITINPNKRTEEILANLSKIANGLYNSALYENNQRYKAEKKFSFYEDMCKNLKDNELYGLLASQSAQAVLQKVEGNIKSFLALHKKTATAGFPHYHKKDTEWVLPYKSQQIKLKKNKITLPMSLAYRKQTGISYISFRIPKLRYEGRLAYLEIFKSEGTWKVSLVFDVQDAEPQTPRENLYIDIGVKNLAAIYDGKNTTLYKGGVALAENQYKDKKVAEVQKILATQKKRTSKEKRRLAKQAKRKIKQQIHAMTSNIVNTAKNEGKGIVIGDLNGIRKSMHFRKKTNQKDHQWMFGQITSQLEYKSKLNGVMFRKVSEKDTSKTCALCGKEEHGRIHRGMYRCKLYNVAFNADADGALNIMKKYLRVPLSKGSGIGVVAALAQPAVLQWNEHEWRNEAMMPSATTAMIS